MSSLSIQRKDGSDRRTKHVCNRLQTFNKNKAANPKTKLRFILIKNMFFMLELMLNL